MQEHRVSCHLGNSVLNKLKMAPEHASSKVQFHLVNSTLQLFDVEVTFTRGVWAGHTGLLLLHKASWAALTWVAFTVLLYLGAAIAWMFALLATCTWPPIRITVGTILSNTARCLWHNVQIGVPCSL